MNKITKIFKWIDNRGFVWTFLYLLRLVFLKSTTIWQNVTDRVEQLLIRYETNNFLTGTSVVSSQYHTVDLNRDQWDSYDWSKAGEEWTEHASGSNRDPTEWKAALIENMMWKYIVPGSTVLEIGPGAGRWSVHLLDKVGRLFLADISKKCLELCQYRFQNNKNIEYYQVTNEGLGHISDQTVDYIWSYDVFVHINPTDTERYIADFRRILKPGGYGIIHHADEYPNEDEKFIRFHRFRSYTNAKFFAHLLEKAGFELVEQNRDLVHIRGDVISVFKKPGQAISLDSDGHSQKIILAGF